MLKFSENTFPVQYPVYGSQGLLIINLRASKKGDKVLFVVFRLLNF